MSTAAVRQRTSAQGAIKSTTAPRSASARYELVCGLQIQLWGEGWGCVTCEEPDGSACWASAQPEERAAELAVWCRQPEHVCLCSCSFPRALSPHGLPVCSSLAGLEGPPAHLRPVGRGDGAGRRGARCGQRHGESHRLSTATSSAVHQERGAAGWIGHPV